MSCANFSYHASSSRRKMECNPNCRKRRVAAFSKMSSPLDDEINLDENLTPFKDFGDFIGQNTPGGSQFGDDFVVGENAVTGPRSQMFYDASKTALRVGMVDGTQWDDANVGQSSFASGINVLAFGVSSHAEGQETAAEGNYSHAEGFDTVASGEYSHAEGLGVTAFGDGSHAEGNSTISQGRYSHAEGNISWAQGEGSHAEGSATRAVGVSSHAEGSGTTAFGDRSHSEGFQTLAEGVSSHAEGNFTKATGLYSHAEGSGTTASGEGSHAEGLDTYAIGLASHVEGGQNIAEGIVSHAEGISSHAIGNISHAEGSNNIAEGDGSHAEGGETRAFGQFSHAEGRGTTAYGESSHAEGRDTLTGGANSHAEGQNTMATGTNSHAEGQGCTARGVSSHAEGTETYALADYSHAEGFQTVAAGLASHAGGSSSNTFHTNDFAHGTGVSTNAVGPAQADNTIFGVFGDVQTSNTHQFRSAPGAIHSPGFFIANGTSLVSPQIGFSITNVNGNNEIVDEHLRARARQFIAFGTPAIVTAAGLNSDVVGFIGGGGAADFAEYFEFESADQNLPCRFVTFNGVDGITCNERIRLANSSDDYVLGVVSTNAFVLGNNYGYWPGKYELTEHGYGVSEDSMLQGYVDTIGKRFDALVESDPKRRRQLISVVQEQIFHDLKPDMYFESNYEAIRTRTEERINASDLFTQQEKEDLLSLEGITPVQRVKISDEWDPSREYVSRGIRPEWATIGLVGQVVVDDDGTCVVGGFCKVGKEGKATLSSSPTDLRWRVIKRTGKESVRIVLK